MEKRGQVDRASRTLDSYFLSELFVHTKGQVTVFVIIAIVIVAVGVLLYLFYPRINAVFESDAEPAAFLRSCIEENLRENMNLLASQGGYAAPEGSVLYMDREVKYLCYNAQYFVRTGGTPCFVQQPLLRAHFEKELSLLTEKKARECIDELQDRFTRQGYSIRDDGEVSVQTSLILNQMSVYVRAPMTISGETTQTFDTFRFDVPTKMYTLIMTATNIVDFESTYGNAETTLYSQYYPTLQVRKVSHSTDPSTTIYIVRSLDSGEEFTFASRSLAWPGGYGQFG